MKSARSGRILVALLLTFAWPVPARGQGDAARKAIIVGWDGAVPAFVHKLQAERKLPNLSRLMAGGAFSDRVVPAFPSLTAAGFATLWTGAPPRITGISGNRIPRTPRADFTVLESAIGFNPALLRAENLAAAAQRAGRKTVVAYAPLAGAPQGGVHFQAYVGILGRDGVVSGTTARLRKAGGWKNLPETAESPVEAVFSVSSATLFALLIDDPGDTQQGYDTLLITGSRDGGAVLARLKAAPPGPGSDLFWSGAVEIPSAAREPAISYFRLFELKKDGSDFCLYFTRPTRTTLPPVGLASQPSPSIRAFAGNGANLLYVQGAFGSTIPQGGDGTAERRYLETAMFVQQQAIETSRWALEHLPWDIYFTYVPYPDEAEHLWRGYLDPSLEGFKPDVAARLQPFLERVYEKADELLGVLMELRPKDAVVALVSDHGVDATGKLLAINKALQSAGLLKADKNGRIDLSGTKVILPSFNTGYLLINSSDRKNGIVTPAQRDAVVAQTRQALLNIRDDGRPVVLAVYDAATEGATLGIGGETGGDLYLDIAPGYELDPRLTGADVITRRDPHGMHGFNPARPAMRTLMVLNGPGVKSGALVSDVRLVDFAPTIARLLNIAPPKDSWGRVLEEALADAP